jgi:hypothetical protein
MRKITIFSLALILFFILTSNTLADVSFTNDIELSDESINFTIVENYTGEDAQIFKNDFDLDQNGIIEKSELSKFKSDFMENRADQFLEYIILDDEYSSLGMKSLSMEFDGVEGNIDDGDILVTTVVSYGFNVSSPLVPMSFTNNNLWEFWDLNEDVTNRQNTWGNISYDFGQESPSLLSSGDHNLWILGHPSIKYMKISFPENIELVSYAGLENVNQSTKNGLSILEGSSGIRSFMIDDKQTLEYAVFLEISKESFYDKKLYNNEFFLPLLVIIEIALALCAIYINNKNKIK